jgi:hypothetical protein
LLVGWVVEVNIFLAKYFSGVRKLLSFPFPPFFTILHSHLTFTLPMMPDIASHRRQVIASRDDIFLLSFFTTFFSLKDDYDAS